VTFYNFLAKRNDMQCGYHLALGKRMKKKDVHVRTPKLLSLSFDFRVIIRTDHVT